MVVWVCRRQRGRGEGGQSYGRSRQVRVEEDGPCETERLVKADCADQERESLG